MKRVTHVARKWLWCEQCQQHIDTNAEHGDHMSKPAEQLYIDGTEPPPDPAKDHEADDRLYAWLDAKSAQKKAADATRIKHASLLERLGELGIDRYPYVDRFTGKKRFLVVKREPKAATTNAPKLRRPRAKREREKPDPAEQVEHRKVSRASVESEIDPFATTRAAMESA